MNLITIFEKLAKRQYLLGQNRSVINDHSIRLDTSSAISCSTFKIARAFATAIVMQGSYRSHGGNEIYRMLLTARPFSRYQKPFKKNQCREEFLKGAGALASANFRSSLELRKGLSRTIEQLETLKNLYLIEYRRDIEIT